MLVIRLTRVGKKNSPAYRVVVADKRRAVKRKFIEIIGNYNPTLKPKTVVIDKERALFWINLGAQPSDTVRNLMCNLGVLDKKERINKVYGKKLSKKVAKEGENKKPEIKPITATEEPVTKTESAVVSESATEAPTDEITETVKPESPVEEVVAEEIKTAPTSEESESRPESVEKEASESAKSESSS